MLKKTLIAVGVILVGLLLLVAVQPSQFKVTRSAKINAPPAVVFQQINDFHHWNAWSPWAKLDPQAKNTFEGPEAGEGAKFAWDGNDDIGSGKMTITKSEPEKLVLIDLEFIRPFAGKCLTEFQVEPAADNAGESTVTWSMTGQNSFIAKAMHLVMDMDKMVGGDFEKGLASMKQIAESEAKPTEAPTQPAEDAKPAEVKPVEASQPADAAKEPAPPQ